MFPELLCLGTLVSRESSKFKEGIQRSPRPVREGSGNSRPLVLPFQKVETKALRPQRVRAVRAEPPVLGRSWGEVVLRQRCTTCRGDRPRGQGPGDPFYPPIPGIHDKDVRTVPMGDLPAQPQLPGAQKPGVCEEGGGRKGCPWASQDQPETWPLVRAPRGERRGTRPGESGTSGTPDCPSVLKLLWVGTQR